MQSWQVNSEFFFFLKENVKHEWCVYFRIALKSNCQRHPNGLIGKSKQNSTCILLLYNYTLFEIDILDFTILLIP